MQPLENPVTYFLFPGQGSQHPNMAREIYESEPVFRDAVDLCCEILRPHLNLNLQDLLYPSSDAPAEAKRRVTDTIIAQPAIFTIEYALAQLWSSWGIRPDAMLGHSVGEFVAACLAGVFSLEDALALIAARGAMMQQVPTGGMLSVRLPETEVRLRLNGQGLSVAAVNAPSLCVVAGPTDALESFEAQLTQEGTASRRLVTSHAFHSPMMDPVLAPFTERVEQVRRHPSRMPFVSSVTGTWIRDEEATDAAYWARHLRAPVQFSAGVAALLQNPNGVLLEVGPGNTLSTLARQHTSSTDGRSGSARMIVSSLGDSSSSQGSYLNLMSAVGSLWFAGLQPDWKAVHAGERRHRVSLPTYPFERKRYWLETPADDESTSPVESKPLHSLGFETPTSEEALNVNAQLQSLSPSTPTTPGNRSTRIMTALTEIFEDLSGTRVSSADSSSTFLELGFDSLFLTQVAQALQAKFGIKITFRQLLGDLSTLQALAEHIDAQLPADAMKDAAQGSKNPPPVIPVGNTATPPQPVSTLITGTPLDGARFSSDSPVERLVREQLQTMTQLFAKQLEAVRGMAPAPTAVNVIASPSIVSPAIEQRPSATTLKSHSSISQATPSAKSASPDKEEFKPFGPYKPPQKGTSGELTDRQNEYLTAFIERYTQRTQKSKNLTQEFRLPLADPRVVSGFRTQWKEMVYPIIAVGSKGSHLWDADGNEYIDILNGFGPIMLGHRPDFVEEAIERQLHEGFEIGPQTLLAGEVAKAFCDMTGNERMTFCNTGSEGVIAALRVARTVTGRSKVVLFAGSYHGMFDEVLVKGVKSSSGPRSLPIAPGIPRESVGNVVVLDYGTPESLDWIRQNAKDLAAVLVEPVQSRHPNLQPRDFLHEIRNITQQSGTALIFDEVVTGFRVHPGGCQALFDIRADLATYGKVLAGGMPIGVLAGKAQFMDALDGGAWQFGDDSFPSVGVTFFAGTFVRHPLTLAAVKAVLAHFKEQGPQLQEQLSAKTASLVRSLNDLIERNGVPTRIENFASIFYFSFPNDFPLGGLFHYHLRQKGIYLLEGFPCFLTTSHTDADIQKIIRAFQESIAEMQAGGIFLEAKADVQPSNYAKYIAPVTVSPVARPPQSVTPAATSAATPAEAPLSESQLEIWLSAQLSEEASCAYNESFTLHLRGPLDEEALRSSLQQLLDRHEALRATIVPERNYLRFSPHVELQVPLEDLSSKNSEERNGRLEAIKIQEACTPFNLINGPLVRARLIRLEPRHHALIFTSHHIVCDGWSTNVLLDEFAKLYSSRSTGANPQLPIPVRFGEYAQNQAERSETSKAEAYWLSQFQQLPPVLELPSDRPRPPIKSFKGSTYRSRIDASTYKQVKQAGTRQGCTLFVTLFSSFASLLHRVSAQDDIVIGIPTAAQSLLEEGPLVGHCVNFLPLRVRLAENQSAAELLKQVKRTLLDAYEHQNYTYGTLVRKLRLRRDPSRLPLVEVQFNLEKVGAGLDFSGLQVEVDPNPKSSVNFDLFFNVVESENGLLIDCDFNSDLFDRETIARWLAHFETLLKAFASDPAQSVNRLSFLGEKELQKLQEWNATSADYPSDACVHQLIETQAKRTPNATALTFENQSLTYAELDRQANQFARHLMKVGVTHGSMVGVSMDRSLEMMIALLGIWKAGASYLPVDPAYPRERLSFILEETAIPVLVTQSKLVSRLPVMDIRLVCFDRDRVLFARESDIDLDLSTNSESTAYTIFTSGSSGKPKGVEVTHHNLVNLLCSMQKRPGLKPTDRLLAVTTLSFDIAALELFLPLITGAQVILCSRDTSMDGRRLLKLMSDSAATVMQATPSTWRLLLEAGWGKTQPLKILCGGEALPRDLANELVAHGEVWNMYGPTETTVWSAISRVEAGDGPVTLGPPIHNTQFYVLDKHSQLAPIGIAGELHIGGDGVAKGYHKKPQLTAERFVPDPFAKNPDARLYKTGDLVRWRPDGRLEFLGRLDDQVKVRGFRIELGEIESVLARHPEVRACAVVAQEDEPGLKRLVAYLVTDEFKKPSSDDLRRFVGAQLPDYMVPSIFNFIPVLPQTPNGKIDRKALLTSDAQILREQKSFTPPRTPTEQELTRACADVLHLDRISITDSLFDLGADSLHLFQIIARAAHAGITITPQQILRLRTISAIATEADRDTLGTRDPKIPSKIAPVSRERYQLTSAPQAT